jgi:hypothetical protein
VKNKLLHGNNPNPAKNSSTALVSLWSEANLFLRVLMLGSGLPAHDPFEL